MQERTSIGLAAAAVLTLVVGTTGCASAPQVPEVPEAVEVPGIAVDPAQDFARPERARARMRSERREEIPGETEEEAAERRGDGQWRYRGEFYLWAPSVDGEVSGDADVDLSVSDAIDAALAGRLEGGDGDWGFTLEYIRIRTEDEDGDSEVSGVSFEPEIDLDIVELAATKSLGSAHTFSKYSPAVSYEAIGGARYFNADTKLNFGGGATADAGDEDWVDPFIGARAVIPMTDRTTFGLRGDIGGFGLGEASDISWRADAVIRVRVYESLGAFAGWQAIGVDKDRGSGPGKYKFDLTFSGPYLGMQLDF